MARQVSPPQDILKHGSACDRFPSYETARASVRNGEVLCYVWRHPTDSLLVSTIDDARDFDTYMQRANMVLGTYAIAPASLDAMVVRDEPDESAIAAEILPAAVVTILGVLFAIGLGFMLLFLHHS